MTLSKHKQHCRACRGKLEAAPLLQYFDMPCAAQQFPLLEDLSKDKGAELKIYQCTNCGLVQTPAPPVSYYREVIRAAAFSQEMHEFRKFQFLQFVQNYQLAEKPVLEVGCGHGEYLSLLQEANVHAHGIEYSASAVNTCRSAGLSVSRGFISRPGQIIKTGPFSAFVTLNFMEHWPNPVASLRGIHNNLVDEGIGLVEVPNLNMILDKGLYSEFISDHLSYFTIETLTYTLQSAGFAVLECKSIWHNYILSAVVKKRAMVDLRLLHRRQTEVAVALESFIRRFPTGSVAIWGAGHQALATIALSGIGDHIKYVVDSAPFKQGRFTPATHLPIVHPDTLKTDPAKAVIIMAAAYSDEIYRIIRARYGQKIEVAILRDFGLETRQ